LRVRADAASSTVIDLWAGSVTGLVDDFVLVRNDGTYAYNLAVVVDDLAMDVDQVCRGDDLLSSSPRQAWLTRRLGGVAPGYAHVPLAVNASGQRLAKRDGAVTLAELEALGVTPAQVLTRLAASLDLASPEEPVTTALLLSRFDPAKLPRAPWLLS
jgi:glutamyl-tRNA synthetase